MIVIKNFRLRIFDMQIKNTLECFVQLWQQLERKRQLRAVQGRRFCLCSKIKSWVQLGIIDLYGNVQQSPISKSSDSKLLGDLIWEVCMRASRPGNEVYGLDQLPPPTTHPRIHREILIALLMVTLRLGKHNVRLHDLDEAYHLAFPNSTPLNVSKKRKASSNDL